MNYTKWNDPKNYSRMTAELAELAVPENPIFAARDNEHIEHSFVQYCIGEMMKWKLEDSTVAKNQMSMRNKMMIGIMCALMVGIFFADDWQQRRFAALRYGYYSMGQRQYEEAIDLFEQYLNVESDIYWYLMELVNGESYSCKNVSDCLAECRVLKEKIYHEGV